MPDRAFLGFFTTSFFCKGEEFAVVGRETRLVEVGARRRAAGWWLSRRTLKL